MHDVKQIVEEINKALFDVNIDEGQFGNLLEKMVEKEKIKIKILDFEYYNEERLQHATKEKIEGVKSQNFEWAASWRDKEKKILKYIELRKEFNVDKSMFHFEEGFLLYLYLGTAKNDKLIKRIINEKYIS